MKISFLRCRSCKTWVTYFICPRCKEPIRCGELLDEFSAEYALGGCFEDCVSGGDLKCDCGFSATVGEWKKTKELDVEDSQLYETRVVFDVDFDEY